MKYKYQGGVWYVWNKTGTEYRFGSASSSRQENPAGIFKWCLDQVTDTHGNYITFSYFHELGEIYLDGIQYTGGVGLSPRYTVDFVLEDRTDISINYISGYEVTTAKGRTVSNLMILKVPEGKAQEFCQQ